MRASIFNHPHVWPTLNGRIKAVVTSTIGAVLLSGCVGASSSFKLPPSYGHQPGGSYMLSSWERGLDCTGLHLALDQRFKQMQKIANAEKTARRGLPRTLMEAVSWKNGNPTGYGKRFKRHQLLRAEALSLHRTSKAKNCPQTIDLVQQIAETQLPGQQPAPLYRTATGQPEAYQAAPAAAPTTLDNTSAPSALSEPRPAL